MPKIFIIVFLILFSTCGTSQEEKNTSFNFSNNQIGRFAKDWFTSVNSGSFVELKKYDPNGEWNDLLERFHSLSQLVKGISPSMISYETKNKISIYSKQGKGSWVKVNLELTDENQIVFMNIKKSVAPVDYKLKNSLTKRKTSKIIKEISESLINKYVDKRYNALYAEKLLQLYKEGNYDKITQGDLLADMLTADLRKLSNDKHLQVIPPSRINEVKRRFGLNDDIPSKITPDKPHEEVDEDVIQSKVLENNIGYIRLNRFVDNEKVKLKTKKIFSEFNQVKAIIIDLRSSGGGDGKAMEDLLSYFTSSESATYQTPLYVLSSRRTISAGEAFIHNLKKLKRANIIGETTAGAGYMVDAFEVAYGFYFVNSIYSPYDIENGEGWQGKGVNPDHKVSSRKALEKALKMINQ